MLTGLYFAGSSVLHRAPAGTKLAGLLLLTTALVGLRTPLAVAAGAVITVLAYAIARLRPKDVWVQVRPLRWVALVLVPFQLWNGGPTAAIVVVGTLLVAVAAAGLVTLTTRLTEMLDAMLWCLRPLRLVGVDPARVALVLSLTIRAIPVLASTFDEVREARRARGLERSPKALVTPLVVRTLRHADRLGEALAARGLDD